MVAVKMKKKGIFFTVGPAKPQVTRLGDGQLRERGLPLLRMSICCCSEFSFIPQGQYQLLPVQNNHFSGNTFQKDRLKQERGKT